jgi:hypothetical protein
MDRVRIDFTSPNSMGLDITEYEEMRDLTREGLDLLSDASAERRAALVEMSAFMELVIENTSKLGEEWRRRRAELVASGLLPELPKGATR